MRIWLDDIRPMPEGFDFHAKTSEEAIARLPEATYISFDHDLGGEDTGYRVACEIERRIVEEGAEMIPWQIHSANPVGRQRIMGAMARCGEFLSQRRQ